MDKKNDSKNVSLDVKNWAALEELRKKKDLPSLSNALEEVLKEFVEECKKKFGKDLVSIVFYGSRVKGYAREDSDYDILIVARNLPDIKERFSLVEEIEDRIWEKYKIKISSILVEPEEIFEPVNPLLFGVLTGYKVLFGKEAFKENLRKAKSWIEKYNPIYIEGEKEWEIKKLI